MHSLLDRLKSPVFKKQLIAVVGAIISYLTLIYIPHFFDLERANTLSLIISNAFLLSSWFLNSLAYQSSEANQLSWMTILSLLLAWLLYILLASSFLKNADQNYFIASLVTIALGGVFFLKEYYRIHGNFKFENSFYFIFSLFACALLALGILVGMNWAVLFVALCIYLLPLVLFKLKQSLNFQFNFQAVRRAYAAGLSDVPGYVSTYLFFIYPAVLIPTLYAKYRADVALIGLISPVLALANTAVIPEPKKFAHGSLWRNIGLLGILTYGLGFALFLKFDHFPVLCMSLAVFHAMAYSVAKSNLKVGVFFLASIVSPAFFYGLTIMFNPIDTQKVSWFLSTAMFIQFLVYMFTVRAQYEKNT